jgi:hypothetical protein
VEEEVSLPLVTEHVRRNYEGMMVGLPPEGWLQFRGLSAVEMGVTRCPLRQLSCPPTSYGDRVWSKWLPWGKTSVTPLRCFARPREPS